jgi:hypothetical protein
VDESTSTEAKDKSFVRSHRSSTVPFEGSSSTASLDPIPLPLIKQSHFHRRPKSVTLVQPRDKSVSGFDATRVQKKSIYAPLQINEVNRHAEDNSYSITGENGQISSFTEQPKQAPIASASSCLPQFCAINNGEKMDDDITMYSPIE